MIFWRILDNYYSYLNINLNISNKKEELFVYDVGVVKPDDIKSIYLCGFYNFSNGEVDFLNKI